MRRDPALTFEGALRLLDKYEPKYVGAIDKFLGGALLAGGIGLTVATGSPLALIAPLWGWVDQKNEAVGLLRSIRSNLTARLSATAGHERAKLIHAAHTLIVVSAYFEALEDHLGKQLMANLEITEAEKLRLIDGQSLMGRDDGLTVLYDAEVPAPTAAVGFYENLGAVEDWYTRLTSRLSAFLSGLDAWHREGCDLSTMAQLSSERYKALFLALASSVVEFRIWSLLGEHAATRTAVREVGADLGRVFEIQQGALVRFEELLKLAQGKPRVERDLQQVLFKANRSALDQELAPGGGPQTDLPLAYPTVGEAYITPRYRIAVMDPAARPANEEWWEGIPVEENLDLMLAGHVLSAGSARHPLLLLGHPGAGKSMLARILAARLPADNYTTVRVSLRGVSANASVADQIQESLDLTTNHRIEWSLLADQCAHTTRVVILDGLDELLQASNLDRAVYLKDVVKFQETEGNQDRPVVVIVTSRTVVADRVEIPLDCPIVKLEDFAPEQTDSFLEIWRETNQTMIARGLIRPVTKAEVGRQPELARQPLLLFMLAVYLSDPASPTLDQNTSTTKLYQRLFEGFVRREVLKDERISVRSEAYEQLADQQLDRLAVAALAMFNRGAQYVGEADLGDDLAALFGRPAERASSGELGRRLLGEFFFVHTAEAVLQGAADVRRGGRTYEFLHATFGEYLVAQHILDVLQDVAGSAFGGRRVREPDDDLLFALLSHQPLAGRKSTAEFVAELASELSESVLDDIRTVLKTILMGYRNRHGSDKYADYRPLDRDRLRELAAYSANLVLLADALGEPSPFDLFDGNREAWRSMVDLWHAGLDADGWTAMLNRFYWHPVQVTFGAIGSGLDASLYEEMQYAALVDDRGARIRSQISSVLYDGVAYYDIEEGKYWAASMLSWLIPAVANRPFAPLVADPPDWVPAIERRAVASQIAVLLRQRRLNQSDAIDIVKLYLHLVADDEVDSGALALAVADNPALLVEVPAIQSPSLYLNGDLLNTYVLLFQLVPVTGTGGELMAAVHHDLLDHLAAALEGVVDLPREVSASALRLVHMATTFTRSPADLGTIADLQPQLADDDPIDGPD